MYYVTASGYVVMYSKNLVTCFAVLCGINIVGSMDLAQYRNFPTIYGVVFDYFNPIIQLFLSLISSDCSFHI